MSTYLYTGGLQGIHSVGGSPSVSVQSESKSAKSASGVNVRPRLNRRAGGTLSNMKGIPNSGDTIQPWASAG